MADRSHPLLAIAAAAPDCAAARLVALPPCTRLVIRGDAPALAPLGMHLPEPCRCTTEGDRALLWLGPDEFLLLMPDDVVPALDIQPLACIVDVSHRDAAVSVSGSSAAWVINAFCPLDLHISAFPVGMCTRTVFGKAAILLWRSEADSFRIEMARSFAPYVWACLEEARRELLT